ncbi:polysaccharide export protein [Altererythrobacter sp. JGD-16]|uniref:Polysaccharide export protein n=2 Tax=Altererythrobacter lutimaris TaxID=2743979 RepID=A0A850H6Y8_9SPHN|nr:polysaccharide export protein [Altererythrobacter lutimaris]
MLRISQMFALLGAMLLGLSACASGTPPIADASMDAPSYRIGAGDRLKVTVFGEDALSNEYVVTSVGDIAFPLLGAIPVEGKTVEESAKLLTDRLASGYLNDPRVSMEVLNYRPFYILGEVTSSGEFAYRANLTATQAIALAGGYSYRADKNKVFIRRAGETEERTYILKPDQPVWILPGDTVRIGERFL